MTEIDTSAEAVEQLALFHALSADLYDAEEERGLHACCVVTAAMLRALLAEREQLQAGLLKSIQYDNKCDQAGAPCREPERCGCYLEAQTWLG